MERSRAWLEALHDEGRRAAKRFIARDGEAIGVRETLDIAKAFADRHKPKVRMPAHDDMPIQRTESRPFRATG